MPCDTVKLTEESKVLQRTALQKLESMLALGQAQAVVSPTGAVAFRGWQGEKAGLTDVCAYRRLLASNSPGLRKALARAEALAGRKVDQRVVSAGVHSHDGGKTWGRH